MIIELLDLAGVAVFAISGALAAGRKSLDWVGVVVLATVTAIGGGTLRDLLLGRQPVFWIEQPIYLYVILAAALLTVAYTRRFPPPERGLAIADAFGLAFFAISGAQIAEDRGHAYAVVVMMGTLTGAAGGLMRDVLCAQIPMILRVGQLYASAAIIGVIVYLVLQQFADRTVAALVGMSCVAGLRLAAIFWKWAVPTFTLPHSGDDMR